MNSCTTPVEKLMQWHSKYGWIKYEHADKCILKIYYDQLIITSNDKILESLSLRTNMKGFFKGDVFILVLQDTLNGIRKLKFQFCYNALDFVEKLGDRFNIVNNSNKNTIQVTQTHARYRNFVQVLQDAVNSYRDDSSCKDAPESYQNFLKLCLMDPTFPQFVNDTEQILQSLNP